VSGVNVNKNFHLIAFTRIFEVKMKHYLTITLVLLAITSERAATQAAQSSHSVVGTCGIHYGNQKLPTQFTPIARVSLPVIPPGSREPQTAFVINVDWKQFVSNTGVRHYTSFCVFGGNIDEVRRAVSAWESRSGYGVMPKEELAFDKTWRPLLAFLYERNRFYPDIKRDLYNAEVIGSVTDDTPKGKFVY
jgi:hypothetical protein